MTDQSRPSTLQSAAAVVLKYKLQIRVIIDKNNEYICYNVIVADITSENHTHLQFLCQVYVSLYQLTRRGNPHVYHHNQNEFVSRVQAVKFTMVYKAHGNCETFNIPFINHVSVLIYIKSG